MPSSKRAAQNAWKTRNLATIACRVYRADAEEFRRYCEERGQTANELLRAYVAECLGHPLERRA